MTHHLTADLRTPLAEHRAGHCARHLQVTKAAGITLTWQGDRKRERQPRNRSSASRRPGMRQQAPAPRQPSEQDRQP